MVINKRRFTKRLVFRKKRINTKTLLVRSSIISLMMLSCSILILTIINKIPNRLIWQSQIREIWFDLIDGITKVLLSLIFFGKGLIILVAMIIALLLLLGGILRIVRVASYIYSLYHMKK